MQILNVVPEKGCRRQKKNFFFGSRHEPAGGGRSEKEKIVCGGKNGEILFLLPVTAVDTVCFVYTESGGFFWRHAQWYALGNK